MTITSLRRSGHTVLVTAIEDKTSIHLRRQLFVSSMSNVFPIPSSLEVSSDGKPRFPNPVCLYSLDFAHGYVIFVNDTSGLTVVTTLSGFSLWYSVSCRARDHIKIDNKTVCV